jgi:predicted GNAT family N-acyltransferase
MRQKNNWLVRFADWEQDQALLKEVRRRVFIEEQQVPEAMEWDEHDKASTHFLAIHQPSGTPIGTARLLPDGQIGRMAVLPAWRGSGVGTALLRAALAACPGSALLHAQVHAIPFYAAQGFVTSGEVFMEAGIPHQKMIHSANPASGQTSVT